jgi:tetratricopeptide (TPR) repeat protein
LPRLVSLVALVAVTAGACRSSWERADAALKEGKALAAAGRVDEALARFETAVRIDPRLHEAHGRAARLELDRGRFGEAKRHAFAAVALAPTSGYYREMLGRAHAALGEDADAVSQLTGAMQLDPGRKRLGFELGRVHERLGRPEAALRDYRAAAEADAAAVAPRVAIARLVSNEGDVVALIRALHEARDAARAADVTAYDDELAALEARATALRERRRE